MRDVVLASLLLFAPCRPAAAQTDAFVRATPGGFTRGGQPYSYVGVNMWYAATLGSEGPGGDRERLCRELDILRENGLTNLRVLATSQGNWPDSTRVWPVSQPTAHEFDSQMLAGLDYLLQQLETRHMTCVLYLNNAWDWSGGFGAYLRWAGEDVSAGGENWHWFQQQHSRYWHSATAQELSMQTIQQLVGRTNTLTGLPYSQSPAIMAWELSNEPRPFANDSLTRALFLQGMAAQAAEIKRLDPNHLVTTGSEGENGCGGDLQLFEKLHSIAEIDYLCIHYWPYNWNDLGFYCPTIREAVEKNGKDSPRNSVERACRNTLSYVTRHADVARRLGKPLVLEEFGYPRDGYAFDLGSPTTARDDYFRYVVSLQRDSLLVHGCNVWAWGGQAVPRHERWQMGDPYTGDPAQEEQGLNSVFSGDKSTLVILRAK